MYCIRCGAQNQDDAAVCAQCGSALVRPQSTRGEYFWDELPIFVHVALYLALVGALLTFAVLFIPLIAIVVLLIVFVGVFLHRIFQTRPAKYDILAASVGARPVIFQLESMALLGVILGLTFVVIYPFVELVSLSFTISQFYEPTRYGLGNWDFALTDSSMLEALRHTVYLTLTRQIIAIPIALLLAWLIARTNMPGGKSLEFFFWIAIFLPSVSMVQAWILIAEPTTGILNRAVATLPFVTDRGLFNIFSFWGIVWVHLATKTIAINVIVLTFAFRRIGAVGANGAQTSIPVHHPALVPAVLLAVVAAVIFSEFWAAQAAFETELILGGPIRYLTFASKMFILIRQEPPQFGAAAAMGAAVLFAVVPLVILFRWAITSRYLASSGGQSRTPTFHLQQWRWPTFTLVLSMGLLLTLVPIGFLLMGTFMRLSGYFDVPGGAWTLDNWNVVLTDRVFMRSVKNSLYTASGAATFSAFAFTFLAYIIVRAQSRILRGVTDVLTWFPFALTGVVLALAWLWITLQSYTPQYGTIPILILVSGLGGMTIGVQLIKANMMPMGAGPEEDSSINRAQWFSGLFFTGLFKVAVPRLAHAIALVWVLGFVFAAGTAIIPAFLSTPSTRTLSLLQLEFVQSGWQEKGAVVGVIVVLLTAGVVTLAWIVGSLARRTRD